MGTIRVASSPTGDARLRHLQEARVPAQAGEDVDDLVELLEGVRGHVRRPDHALVRRDRGGDDRVREDARVVQAPPELERLQVPADADRDDGRAALADVVTQVEQLRLHPRDVLPETLAAL